MFRTSSARETEPPPCSTISDAAGVWWKMRMGSTLPARVPPGRPSSGERPMLVSALRPRRIMHTLAPLPRCATTRLHAASGLPRCAAVSRRMLAYESPCAPYLRSGIGGSSCGGSSGYV